MKDGRQITSDNRITVTRNALQFNALHSTDNGSYIVTVSNIIDITNSSLELMVYCKLKILLSIEVIYQFLYLQMDQSLKNILIVQYGLNLKLVPVVIY